MLYVENYIKIKDFHAFLGCLWHPHVYITMCSAHYFWVSTKSSLRLFFEPSKSGGLFHYASIHADVL